MHSKLINNLNSQQILDLREVAERYKELDEETIFSYLWKMTYDPEYALKKTGLTDEIYLELYKKVRNYIFEEYEKPEVLGSPETYNEELFRALGQDKFAYCFICRKIQNALYYSSESDLNRIGALLNSDLSSNQFGGLRSLGLTVSEAKFFESYENAFSIIKTIFNQKVQEVFEGKLIKENTEDVVKDEREENSDDKNNYLIEIFSKCVENRKQLLAMFDNLYIMYDKYNVTSQEALEDYAFFKRSFDLIEEINKKGIDISWLSENIEALEQILN